MSNLENRLDDIESRLDSIEDEIEKIKKHFNPKIAWDADGNELHFDENIGWH